MIKILLRRFERFERSKAVERLERERSDFQRVFLLSTLRTPNHQELLQNNGWQFPRETWLQNRLKKLRNPETRDPEVHP